MTPSSTFPSPTKTLFPTRIGWGGDGLGGERPVARVRREAASWVRIQWGLDRDLVGTVELVVAELCTNAVRHGGGLTVLELLLRDATAYTSRGLLVLVGDRRPDRPPSPGPADPSADPLAEGGRGLRTVEALTASWGWYPTGSDRKTVWCRLSLPGTGP